MSDWAAGMSEDELGSFVGFLEDQRDAQLELATLLFEFVRDACPDEHVARTGLGTVTVIGRLGAFQVHVLAAGDPGWRSTAP